MAEEKTQAQKDAENRAAQEAEAGVTRTAAPGEDLGVVAKKVITPAAKTTPVVTTLPLKTKKEPTFAQRARAIASGKAIATVMYEDEQAAKK